MKATCSTHRHEVDTPSAGGASPVHRLDPRAKILGLVGVAVVSATTPDGAWRAFAAYALVLVALAAAARLPVPVVAARMLIEVPFLVTAAVLILLVPGGAETGWTLAAKATIGVLAMVVLSLTTPFHRLLRGFEALRLPRVLVLIVAFMWRYLAVLTDEARRMALARQARGYEPRWLWQAGAIARGIAVLFVRALERGERVWVAMLSRGYQGGLPATIGEPLVLRSADVLFVAGLAATLAAVRIAAT